MASSRALYNYNLSTDLSLPCKKSRSCYHYSFQVRAQSYHEGRSSRNNSYNIVDANLGVLRKRIEQVKNKERRCTVVDESTAAGWNYSANDHQDFIIGRRKRDKAEMLHQFVQLVGTIGGTLGLTILGCTFCLCIVSLLAHLNYQ